MEYGKAPIVIAENLDLDVTEMCYVQYLPIWIPGVGFSIPANLQWIKPLLQRIELDPTRYTYVTAKHIYVSGSDCGNRPGWHSDGFGTDDINYIWCDRCPTEFAIQPFSLPEDCENSMMEMEKQFIAGTEVVYPVKTLLRLDPSVIHRTPTNCEPGYRTFVKISVSRDRYNLKGNAHNYGLKYHWPMVERNVERNHPSADVKSH